MRVLLVVAFLAVLIAGCVQQQPPSNNSTIPPGYEVKDYCKADADCVRLNSCCDCGFGVYVNKYNQNNTQCQVRCMCAIAPSHGACQENKCVAVPDNPPPPPPQNNSTIPPGYEVKDFCKQDSDCVRLNACCDCGLGQYVNVYNQQPECLPGQPRCMCPIMESKGLCLDSKCVAAPMNTVEIGVDFKSYRGMCGVEAAPQRVDGDTVVMNGSVGGGDSCRTLSAQLLKSDNGYVLDIHSRAIPGIDTCINCNGTIPWSANITGYSGLIEVRYDGRSVFPDKAGFCGTSTQADCKQDSDCMKGGCSGEVCQGIGEAPAVTSCIYRSCNNAAAFGVKCGCFSQKCQWG